MQEPGDDYDWFSGHYNFPNSHSPAPGYRGESQNENATTPTPVKMDVDVMVGSVHYAGQSGPPSDGTVDISEVLEGPARNLLPVLLQYVETKKPVEQPADVPGLFFVDTVGEVPLVSTVATRLFAAYAAARSARPVREAAALGSSSTSLDTSATPGAGTATTTRELTPFSLEPTQVLHSRPPMQSQGKLKIEKNRAKELKRPAAEQTRLSAPTYRFFQPTPKIFKRAVVLFPPGVPLPPAGLTPAARRDYYDAHVRKAQEKRITTLYPGIPGHVSLVLDCIENGTLVAVYDEHGKLSGFLGRPRHTLNSQEKDDILQYCGGQKYEELLEMMRNREFEHVFESRFPLAKYQPAPALPTQYVLAEEQPQTDKLVQEAAVRKAISRKFNLRLEKACFQQTPVKPGYVFVMKGLNSVYIIELAAKLTKEADNIVYVVFSGRTKKRGIQVPVEILDQVEELERVREEEARESKGLWALLKVDAGRNVRCWSEDYA